MKNKIETILDEARYNGLPTHIVAEQLLDLFSVNQQQNEQKSQSSEVDYQKMFANCKLPNEQLQSSNIDMSDWHFCKVYGFREGVDKCSGCDQDKVREALQDCKETLGILINMGVDSDTVKNSYENAEKALNQKQVR